MSNPARIFVGTSGWAYSAWKPGFYPAKLAQKKFLQHYATRLNAVEVNYSFRRLLTEKTISPWTADTGGHFQFAVKAHQAVTHYRRLRNVEEPLKAFLTSLQPLAREKKLGPLLFQLPPNMKPDPELLEGFLALYGGMSQGFAALLGHNLWAAFEFRHQGWFQEPVYAALRRYNAALCLAESDDFQTPDVSTADFSYFRFRRSAYSASDRHAIADKLKARGADNHPVFAFFKHEEQPQSPLWAEEVLQKAG